MNTDDTKAAEAVQGELVVLPPAPLDVRHSSGMVRPALTVDKTLDAFDEYLRLKQGLDCRMPDAIMEIAGKKYRKAAYWQAVAVAFNLYVGPVKEEVSSMGDDWGYILLYEAVAPNGRRVVADGAAFASEKVNRNGTMPSVHIVRSLAHTRAFNRAVSRLVGFGEVSAEEAHNDDSRSAHSERTTSSAARQARGGDTPRPPAPPPRPPRAG